MTKRRIFTVGFDLPGEEFEYIAFDSDQTLLDADIVLFQPTLGNYSFEYAQQYGGKSILDHHSSYATKRRLDHWHAEIRAAVQAGKLVVVYLAKPKDCYRYTGSTSHSGTGRSRVTTQHVTEVTSYESVPNLKRVTPKFGSEVRLEKAGAYLAAYWADFSGPYEVEIEGEFTTVLRARAGDRVVGGAVHSKGGGVLLFLPPLSYDAQAFLRDAKDDEDGAQYWTKEAIKFGKRLTSALVALADTLKHSVQSTPPPEWSFASKFRLAAETDVELVITQRATEIAELQTKKAKLEGQLKDLGTLRRLLYEQGKPLENAVIEAMTLFGFESKPFDDGESEFDGLFLSEEGRGLGEVEGKDNKAVNIEKFSQLERNLQEDFERDEVTEHAKGILFGNAFRLKPIDEREEFFTAKCASAAKRIGAALVRTPDLFVPAKYLKENPSDSEYAAACRNAIFSTKGEVVVFPTPPVSNTSSISAVGETAESVTLEVGLGKEEPAHSGSKAERAAGC